MRTLFVFLFCTFSVFSQTEPKVTIFYEYTADGYALYAANDEEFPVTIEFDFDLLNLKVVREGPSAIVVPAEAKKRKLVNLVAINVLKGYSFEYTHTVKKGAIKANLEDTIAVSDRAAIKAKEFSKNVDTTDDPKVAKAKLNPRDLRESRIDQEPSNVKPAIGIESKPITSTETLETAKPIETKVDIVAKPIVKTEPTQVAIAKAVKKKERENKKLAEEKLVKKKRVVEIKPGPTKTVGVSTAITGKDLADKAVTQQAASKPVTAPKPKKVIEPIVERTSVEVAIAESSEKKPEVIKSTEAMLKSTDPAVKDVSTSVTTTKPVAVVNSESSKLKETASKPKVAENPKVVTKHETGKPAIAVTTPKKEASSKPEVAERSKVVAKPKTVKPAIVVTTPEKEPVTDVVEIKNVEKPKVEYTITGKYDAAFQYHLPYSKNAVFTVSQGYQGSISHQNKFALDFSMPSGTTIYSSREGTVLDVVENNSQGCATQDCAKYDNYIIIRHSDGSFAKYAHIKADGAVVAIGDVISLGQLIGYTGKTGWTDAPTLHFEVFVQKEKEQKTIKTNFLTGDGTDYGILAEKRRYKREY